MPWTPIRHDPDLPTYAPPADAKVQVQAVDEYPVEVDVKDARTGAVLWHGSQKRLFRKYAREREVAIAEIEAAVRKACK
jgi:hypothetical protein